jgi:uncharacterized protein (DUF58 family)
MWSARSWTRPRSASERPLRAHPALAPIVFAYEDQLTVRGRYLLWAAAVFAVVGLDTRRSQVYLLFAVAAGLLLPALLRAVLPRPRARLLVDLPERATALAPLEIRARVEALRPYEDLRVRLARPVRGREHVEVAPEEVFLSARPGEAAEARFRLLFRKRGRYEMRGPTLRRADPLRLAGTRPVGSGRGTVLVYPRYFRLDAFDAPLGRRYQPGGIPLSSSTGDAIEFVGTRDYREGDPIKNIHWRSWARRGQPVVKEYQEEYFTRLAVVLDTFLSPRPTPAQLAAFEASVSLVASLSDHFSRSEAVVDILAAGPDIYEVSAGRSLAYLDNILDVLACLEPCPDPPFAGVGPPLFDKLSQLTSVVAVLQDWDLERAAFLQKVLGLGTAVRILIVHEGPTSVPWAAAEELGVTTVLSPADVDRMLAVGAGQL